LRISTWRLIGRDGSEATLLRYSRKVCLPGDRKPSRRHELTGVGRSNIMSKLSAWSPNALAILRIMAALLFMEHGVMKLFHFPAPQPGVPDPLPLLLLSAAIIEVAGGALIASGLFTRVAAFICSGEMAAGYFMVHAPKSFWPALNQGDAAIMFSFVFLYLAVAGPGAWSLDAMFRKSAASAPQREAADRTKVSV
jgi:putative oxidoreductase